MLYNIIFAQFSGISKYFASKYRTIPRTIVIKTGPSLVLTFHILSFPENHGKVFLISPGNCSHKIPLLLPQFSTKKNSRKVLDFSDFFFFFPDQNGATTVQGRASLSASRLWQHRRNQNPL